MNYGPGHQGGIYPDVNQNGNFFNQVDYMRHQQLNDNGGAGIRPAGSPYAQPPPPPPTYFNPYGNAAGPSNLSPYANPSVPQNYNPSAPPHYNAYSGPPMQPNFNQYGGPFVPSNYGQPTPSNYNAYSGSPAQANFNQYAGPPLPSNYSPLTPNYGSYSDQYNGVRQPVNAQHTSGSGFINKVERLLHVDLNGDGTIGGISKNPSHQKYHGRKH
ncbi:unnamed protein product [Rotaria magnacalcarata]|uniref:Uncharacterized protein n=4 Tax=Rotaria magnacalcarata TaxID=392030 RepID=A0A816S2X7_9BILA|nr:unnamed protein product [Rotaria magnacalcarata]CAF2152875.1 unnamed protein product [Rotaria magnacalcarata]